MIQRWSNPLEVLCMNTLIASAARVSRHGPFIRASWPKQSIVPQTKQGIALFLHPSTRKSVTRWPISFQVVSRWVQHNAGKKACFVLSGVLKTIIFCPSSGGSSLLLMRSQPVDHHLITPNSQKQRPNWYLPRMREGRWQLNLSASLICVPSTMSRQLTIPVLLQGAGRFIGDCDFFMGARKTSSYVSGPNSWQAPGETEVQSAGYWDLLADFTWKGRGEI